MVDKRLLKDGPGTRAHVDKMLIRVVTNYGTYGILQGTEIF